MPPGSKLRRVANWKAILNLSNIKVANECEGGIGSPRRLLS